MRSTTFNTFGTAGSGFSFSTWLKRNGSNPTANAWFVSEYTASNPSVVGMVLTGGNMLFGVRAGGDTTFTSAASAGDAGSKTAWVHVCGTYTDGGNVKLYLDGTLAGTSVGTDSGAVNDNSVGLMLGSDHAGSNAYSGGNNGYMDETSVFDYDIGSEGCGLIYAGGTGLFW